MRTRTGGVASKRTAVMALAGVTSADGSNFPAIFGRQLRPPPPAPVRPRGRGPRRRSPRRRATRRPAAPAGTRMTPSISGASRWLRATPGSSTSTRTRRPTSWRRRRAVMPSCSSEHSARRSAARPGRPGPAGRGVGALLGGKREESGPVQLGRGQERQQLVVVLLGLARVAHDEGRAQGGVGVDRPDALDAGQEAVAVAPAAHAAQVRSRHVLQGQIEVGAAGRAHDVDQTVGELGWIQVEQAGPGDPGRHRLHQGLDGPAPARGRGRRRPGPGRPARPPRPRARPPRPGCRRRPGTAAGPGTTGWRRTRICGRSLRPP